MADAALKDAARPHITQGALNAIFNEPDTLAEFFPMPVVQCVQIKTLSSQSGGQAERFRLVLSDVTNFVQSMLATQANHIVHDGKLKKGSLLRLKGYQANSVKGKRILIVLDVEVIENLGEPEKIGEPVALITKDEEDSKPVNTTIAGGGFYGNKPAEPAKQAALPSRTAPTSSASHANIYPIEGLSPYAHKWTIKARVTSKSEIKTWSKPSGEGKLFSVNLLDESGEIKATGFNDQCDQLYDLLQEGSVYYISSPCRVNLAKKQFSNLSNDYELSFERDTTVEKAEDQESVPQVKYNFIPNIAGLQEIEKDTTVDVLGVLKEVAEVGEIVSKTTQKAFSKRELTLVDESGFSVKMTIWGKLATAFEAGLETVVAFKGAKVSDFGGRSLSLLSSGTMTLDPDIPDAHRLKGWFDSQGRRENFQSHTGMSSAGAAGGRREETKTVAEVKEQGLGMNETPDYFSVKATIVYIKQDSFSYPACMSSDCNKKVTDMGDGTWRCEKCNINHPRPEHRYIMTLSCVDHTGQLYLNAFDDVGRLVMGGKTADELFDLKENDQPASEKEFENANCRTFTFKCRAKMDSFQDQQRIRYQVMNAMPVDFKSEANKLAALIQQYNLE